MHRLRSQEKYRPTLSTCIIALLIRIPSLVAASSSSSSLPTVDLGYSTYQGISVVDPITNKTNSNFLGIRYAAQPTATLRFAAPHPPAFTSGVQVADALPKRCWAGNIGTQSVNPFTMPVQAGTPHSESLLFDVRNEARSDDDDVVVPPLFDEDCLFLNVYVPGALRSKNQDLPVVVWIHGGGYILGSSAGITGTDIQNGNDLIREGNNGVVVVVIQYRLGIFGFLPGQEVKDGGVLNAGLLDQQFALQWVQKYINRFGGDPTKVTIWGESAGAGSVLQHIIANGGQTHPPLFRAAITSSTFLPPQYKFNDRIPELIYAEAVSQTNCSTSVNTLACLREADINILQAANGNITGNSFFGTFGFAPVVDGLFITDRPTQLLKHGKVNGKVVLSVTNTFEGAIFVDQTNPNINIAQYVTQLFPTFGLKEIRAVQCLIRDLSISGIIGMIRQSEVSDKEQYGGSGANVSHSIAIMSESIFICPTYFLQRSFKNRAFKGEFAIPPGNHGDDVSYYYSSINPDGIPAYNNTQFDASFPKSFLKFAMSLDPNAKFDVEDITPHWSLWKGTNEMLFNRTEGGAPDVRLIQTSNSLLKRCNFWESVAGITGQ